MMKYDTKQNLLHFALFALVISMAIIMSNIIIKGKAEFKTKATAPIQKPTVARDTLRIVGAQPSSHSTNLFIVLADKQGNLLTQSHPLRIWLNNVKPLSDFFERGDTVVMEEGKIVENLTQKRLIDEFTRQK